MIQLECFMVPGKISPIFVLTWTLTYLKEFNKFIILCIYVSYSYFILPCKFDLWYQGLLIEKLGWKLKENRDFKYKLFASFNSRRKTAAVQEPQQRFSFQVYSLHIWKYTHKIGYWRIQDVIDSFWKGKYPDAGLDPWLISSSPGFERVWIFLVLWLLPWFHQGNYQHA